MPTAAFALALFFLARSVHQSGHGWGDDFALYVNQARGLVEGTAGEVVANNRYAMDNSAFAAFTPIAYPWGLPLLLMPIVAVFGIDYDLLKIVPTVSFVVAALLFHRLAARRFGHVAAIAVTLVVAINPWYVWSTDAVLSDLTFMALVFAALVAIDRSVERATLLAGRHGDTIVIGALIAGAFHVRREGLGLLVGVAIAQFAVWRSGRNSPEHERRPWRLWRPAMGPWLSFVVIAGGGHVLFPAPILGNVDVAGDPGLSQVGPNMAWYRQPIAELIGLKRLGDRPVEVLGLEWLGNVLLWTILAAAVIGAVFAVVRGVAGWGGRASTLDAALVGAILGIGLIVMMTPYHYQRYLFTLAPLVVLLALRGLVQTAGLIPVIHRRGWLLQVLVVALLVPTLAHHVREVTSSVRFHTAYSYVHRGPDDAPTQELWTAIERFTDGRDVVVFFQARSMNLYTRRLSIVGNNEQMMVDRADWYAMERNSDYLQTPLTDDRAAELGFVRVWENERYVLWDIPPRPSPTPIDPAPDG